jgi:hypothetical protein
MEAALQHALLKDLVSPYADGELTGDERCELAEHLRSCERCRRELALHQSLSRALAREPAPAASARLRRRIEWMGEPSQGVGEPIFRWSRQWAAPAMAALVVIAVCGGIGLRAVRGEAGTPMADIPVLRDALADCHRATARNFPRKADLAAVGDGLQFPVRALDRPGLELFSTWKTTLAGTGAAGLAYRWRGIVVVQYTVPGELIREQPAVGEALASAGYYAASEWGQGVIAMLHDGSGTLLIADAPPEELRRLML